MKNIIAAVLAVSLIASLLCGCGSTSEHSAVSASDGSVEIIVFAAASLTETLTRLGETYMKENENVKLVFNFDSSGTLRTQIREGAEVDIFISAGQKQMDQLDRNASSEVNTDGADFVLEGTRFDFLENKVALVVPDNNPKGICSYSDMIEVLKTGEAMLAMGNSDVPVGQYTSRLLAYFGVSEDELAAKGAVTYGSNAKEVTLQVLEGAVDFGVVYQTDAFTAGLTVKDTASAEMCGRVIYPAAVMNVSGNAEAARAFMTYLTSEAARAVFEEAGFTHIA